MYWQAWKVSEWRLEQFAFNTDDVGVPSLARNRCASL